MTKRTARSSGEPKPDGDPFWDEWEPPQVVGTGTATPGHGEEELEELEDGYGHPGTRYLYVPDLSSRTGYTAFRVRARGFVPHKPVSGRRIGFRRRDG